MKPYYAFYIVLLLSLCGCGLQEREETVMQMEKENTRKKQELILWEQRLTLWEKELKKKQREIDSTKMQIDSVRIYNPKITGKWHVKMQCTETSCKGWAIGDTKTEQWEIYYKDNNVVAKVYNEDKLNRIYNGQYKASGLHLIDEQKEANTVIRVNLKLTKDDRMEGIREIVQQDCKIIYSVVAERLKD